MAIYSSVKDLVKHGKIGDGRKNGNQKIVAISPSSRRVVIEDGQWRADGSARYCLVTRETGEDVASCATLPLREFIDYCGTDWV